MTLGLALGLGLRVEQHLGIGSLAFHYKPHFGDSLNMCPGVSPKSPAREKAGTHPAVQPELRPFPAVSLAVVMCTDLGARGVGSPGALSRPVVRAEHVGDQARQSPFAASPPGAQGLLGPLPPAAAPPRSRARRQGAGGGTLPGLGSPHLPQRSGPGQWPSDASSVTSVLGSSAALPRAPRPRAGHLTPPTQLSPQRQPSPALRAAHAQPCSPVQGSGWAQGRCLLLAQPGEGPAEFHQRGDPSRRGR